VSRIPARGSRRDGNEPAVIAALESAGCIVKQLSDRGLPDLAVLVPGNDAGPGWVVLLEVKNGKGKLKPDQERFFDLVQGKRLPVFIVRTPEQAVACAFLRPTT
jgi:hypothetical protein